MNKRSFSNIVSEQKSKLDRIYAMGELSFTEATVAIGLDPSRDYVGVNLSQVDFTNCDLSKYDLRGANLNGCNFKGSVVNFKTIDEHYHPMVTYQGGIPAQKMPQPKTEKPEPRTEARLLVGDYIRRRIREKTSTIKEFAHQYEVSPATIVNVLNGRRQISLSLASRLASAFGGTPEYWRFLVDDTISQNMVAPEFQNELVVKKEKQDETDVVFSVDGKTLRISNNTPQHILELVVKEFFASLKDVNKGNAD